MPVLAIQLSMPISAGQAKARGISSSVCQLVVTHAERRESLQLLAREFTSRSLAARVLVVGNFQSAESLSELFSNKSVAEVFGFDLYPVDAHGDLVATLDKIDAEELAVFSVADSSQGEFLAAVARSEAPWWRLSSSSVFAALSSRPDLVDLVGLWSPSDSSIEFLGSRAAVLRVFQRLAKQEEWLSTLPSDV
jgi:hypothetical protein